MANAEDLKKLTKSTACPNGDLTHANLRGVDLKGAQLRGANLMRADLAESILSEADLRGANLAGANLRGTNLEWADLRGQILTEQTSLMPICAEPFWEEPASAILRCPMGVLSSLDAQSGPS